MAFLSGWSYRKSITLSRASGAVTNYQMKLLVGESSGAAGEDVDCGGLIASDFDDLRFTTSDGTTLLDYWIESISGTSPNQLATVWIEFDSIGTGATTFYMYYGGPRSNPVNDSKWIRYGTAAVLPLGAGGAWDNFWVAMHSVVKSGSTYYTYYNGTQSDQIFHIGLATSPDGITWTKDAGNPIIPLGSAGAWDETAVSSPCVWIEGATWYMLYAGKSGSGGWKIGLATSSDGISWTKDGGNPVMSYGGGGTWDSGSVIPGTTMLKEGSTYYLFYWGYESGSSGYSTWKIGLATSTDLVSWSKSGSNPILAGGGSDAWNVGVCEPCVLKFDSTYYMWYQGNLGTPDVTMIGLATSTDKVTWTKQGIVLDNGAAGAWDSGWTEAPVILQGFDGQWRMYYSGSPSAQMAGGLATYRRTGSGNDTFLIFDDFKGLAINTAKWTNAGSWSVDGDTALKYAVDTNAQHLLVSVNDFTGPLAVEARCKVGSDWANEYGWVFAIGFDTGWAATGYMAGHFKAATDDYTRVYKFGTGATNNGTNESIAANTYYRYSMRIGSTGQKVFVDDVQKGTIATSIQTNPTKVYLATGRAASTADFTGYFDYIFARNFQETEPAWGSWGAQENGFPGSGAVTLTGAAPRNDRGIFVPTEVDA